MNHERHEKHESLLLADEVFAIQGALFEVHNAMGVGFLENVYQECVELELTQRGIPFVARTPLSLRYKGIQLAQTYVPDIVCFDAILLELKAVRELAPEHRAQTINYLKASSLRVGLLVNFHAMPKLRIERFAL